MKNLLKNFLLFTLMFLITAVAYAQQETQVLTVNGLTSRVTVHRDGRGIAYVEAGNDADLYFAQGFVTAQDRLFQMDLFRRVARGETAEIFGRMTLEEDRRWRKLGFGHVVEEGWKTAKPEMRAALENYARGVNAYLASLDEKTLPAEFRILQYRPREWTPADSLVIGAIFADALSSTWQMDLLLSSLQNLPKDKLAMMFDPSSRDDVLLFGKDLKTGETGNVRENNQARKNQNFQVNKPEIDASTLVFIAETEQTRQNSLERIGFYAEDLAASNNWVISGKRTLDGKPILANDPHLRPSQPPIWYMIHLSGPDGKVAGVTSAGVPGILLGHNEHIAWGSTNVGPDVQDLYLETFNEKNQYKTPKGWEDAKIRKEEIRVRKNPLSKETEIEVLEVVQTRNGVIVAEEGGKRYALKWTAFDPKLSTLDSFFYINHAKNWDEFRNALRSYGGPMQNFVYADTKGNIGWYAAGKIPIRRTGDGSLPYDGSTDQGEWIGFIPFEELPHLYNPPEGFIVTANQRIVGKSYKYHDLIARVYLPYRAKRIYDLIAANPKMTLNDSSDIQTDTFSILNSRLAREIVKEKAASDETIKILQGWDGRMNPDSHAALLIEEIRIAFRNRLLAGNFGEEMGRRIRWVNEGNFLSKIITEKPREWLPQGVANYAELLRASEIDAREKLIKNLGIDRAKWTWGEANKARFAHPLAAAPLIGMQFAVPTLPAKGSGGLAASPNVNSGVSMRLLAQPPDWDLTRQVITTGQAGDPKSPHWADQLDNWYKGNTPVFPFSKAAVEKASKQTVVLQPK